MSPHQLLHDLYRVEYDCYVLFLPDKNTKVYSDLENSFQHYDYNITGKQYHVDVNEITPYFIQKNLISSKSHVNVYAVLH